MNTATKLAERDEPVRVGIIGAGFFGTKLADAVELAPGMEVTAIADVDEKRAVAAYREARVPETATASVGTAPDANELVDEGKRAILGDGRTLTEMDVDVVAECTGDPEAGARHALSAIVNDKHVVMATAETDSVVGPVLSTLADNAGVTYSMAYGDQPGPIVELVDWARTIGLEVVAAGDGIPVLEEYKYGTPDDALERFGLSDEFIEEHDPNPRMYNSFLDGTKVAVEMCTVANATGLTPDVPGMHFPDASIPEIPRKLRLREDGGLLEEVGAIETVSTLRPDGSTVEDPLGFGVFVVTRTDHEGLQEYFAQFSASRGGFEVANDGEYQVFYRTYHLAGPETPVAIATAALRNESIGAPVDRIAEVVAAAKRDLDPGDAIDGGGGYAVYGQLEAAETASTSGHVPFELLDGAEVVRPVAKDEILTYDHVALDRDSLLYKLRGVQDVGVGVSL